MLDYVEQLFGAFAFLGVVVIELFVLELLRVEVRKNRAVDLYKEVFELPQMVVRPEQLD